MSTMNVSSSVPELPPIERHRMVEPRLAVADAAAGDEAGGIDDGKPRVCCRPSVGARRICRLAVLADANSATLGVGGSAAMMYEPQAEMSSGGSDHPTVSSRVSLPSPSMKIPRPVRGRVSDINLSHG